MSVSELIISTTPDGWDGPGWWPVFPLLWLLLVAGAITTFVLVGRRNRAHAGGRAGEARLAERFASGEITEDEYRHRLSILKERP
ncbi:MAG: SHOCT domain-containing protein [Nocardioidaceae bacterium]|nr:SHOCT domain-containing protein [Nocardioidaceae bacterium]